MQIAVVDGVYADENADIRTSHPVNLIPVPKESGISQGYLRPGDGIVEFGTGPGIDRGGINWRDQAYRVMGTSFVRINPDGSFTSFGDVGGIGQVSMDYSFDVLAIASGGSLFYFDGSGLVRVTDPDLGTVLDVKWVDGYFMTTDGVNLVVTELNDRMAVDPLKYGSSEVDPDPVKGLLKLHNEIHAMNRYTIEAFDNVGGEGFPFARIDGAQIEKGILGTHTACLFADAIAFLGSGRNEAPAIYLGANSQAQRISTREIDQILSEYTEGQLAAAVVEARVDKGHQHLLVHLFDRTLVHDLAASRILQRPVWFFLTSALDGYSMYRARNLVRCYDKWLAGDPTSNKHGFLVASESAHYGQIVRWEFGTPIVYNESVGAIFHQLELVALTGRVALGKDVTISTSYSIDGETWSQEKTIRIGTLGNRTKRLVWLQQGHMRNWRIQRFKGNSDAHLSIARLEAQLEPLGA